MAPEVCAGLREQGALSFLQSNKQGGGSAPSRRKKQYKGGTLKATPKEVRELRRRAESAFNAPPVTEEENVPSFEEFADTFKGLLVF